MSNTKSFECIAIETHGACPCDSCWANAVAAVPAVVCCSRCAQALSGDIDRDADGKPLCWSGCLGGMGPHAGK